MNNTEKQNFKTAISEKYAEIIIMGKKTINTDHGRKTKMGLTDLIRHAIDEYNAAV